MTAGMWVTAKIGDNVIRSKSSPNPRYISNFFFILCVFIDWKLLKGSNHNGVFFKPTVKLSRVQHIEDELEKLSIDILNQDICTKSKLK